MMDPSTEILIKLGLVLMCSTAVFVVMMKLQKRKEERAQRVFEMTLKSRGMSLGIEEDKND